MYLRFIGNEINPETGRHKGIFTLVSELRESNNLLPYEEELVKEFTHWFNTHLPVPDRFTKKKNSYHRNVISTTWFKDSAREIMAKVWEVVHVLEAHSITVEVIRSEKPGYIVYEDEFQIVVEPF